VRILVVCDRGVSRSPTIAALLIAKGHEAIPLGVEASSFGTRRTLGKWAELVIFTDERQIDHFNPLRLANVQVWPIADAYPRPHNPKLRLLVLRKIREQKL